MPREVLGMPFFEKSTWGPELFCRFLAHMGPHSAIGTLWTQAAEDLAGLYDSTTALTSVSQVTLPFQVEVPWTQS